MDCYVTSRKVYVEGARVSEINLPVPDGKLVHDGLASIQLPAVRKERRRMFRRLNFGAVPGYAPICLDSNDPDTVKNAFNQRLFRTVPRSDYDVMQRFRNFVRNFVRTNIPKVRPMDFEEWLSSTSYNDARKNELRFANEQLRGGLPTRKLASHIDTFVKTEFYPTLKHARMINSRHDAFKVWSGPRFKAIEEVIYDLPWFIKHVPVPMRPFKIMDLRKSGCHYYATDFTAFESHFIPKLMNICECELYRWCLANERDAGFLCSILMGPNRMRTRTHVFATCRGRRMSGDMCTSLGNGFTNLMLAMFLVSEKHGSMQGYVEGDDGIFASTVPLTSSDYEKMGFTIKIEEVADPCSASFCGLIFADGGQIVRDPYKFLQGFGWTSSFINAGSRIMDELLRAKALSCVYETPQCPIVGALARAALKRTEHVHPRFVQDGYHDVLPDVVDIPAFAPSMATRELFSVLYGISIQHQLLLERALSSGNMQRVASLLPPPLDVGDRKSVV